MKSCGGSLVLQLSEHVDAVRKEIGRKIGPKQKSDFGQFMTPLTVARFMASLFVPSSLQTARLLDAGAGIGSLSGAFLDRVALGELPFSRVEVMAYEIDDKLRGVLSENLEKYKTQLSLDIGVRSCDFIEDAVDIITQGRRDFTHAILNPPYKKINSSSRHRASIRQVGIETVNLYSAFLSLVIDLMQQGGQIVAIIPRSFCNGPYYKPFRKIIFEKTAIRHMHLFGARNSAFKDDDVLQENIIIVLERDAKQGRVTVSTSTDDKFLDTEINSHPFNQIVFPDDPEQFIHVPTLPEQDNIVSSSACFSLADIGLEVSTGPVVDFRLKGHLRQDPDSGTVPLLYPCHFSGQSVVWPRLGAKKPNAILHNAETEKWLYPSGCYVVVKRFSSKEERRRVVASVIYQDSFNSTVIGLENHLNVLHCGKKGIPEHLARGVAVFLNSTWLDEQFRHFSGHTQVNATDLRLLKYPSRDVLIRLGAWAKEKGELTQQKIDDKVRRLI